ncbi:hypothetical protein Tco_1082576 [Tanacetum coccineum]|uniref:Uncharacterized protein n=1 Tax=Tanacetum coccineum TaxID=301880 RepID=A0ABQ5I1Y6_9ASTR
MGYEDGSTGLRMLDHNLWWIVQQGTTQSVGKDAKGNTNCSSLFLLMNMLLYKGKLSVRTLARPDNRLTSPVVFKSLPSSWSQSFVAGMNKVHDMFSEALLPVDMMGISPKAGEMHAVPPSITGTYMPSPYQSDIEETQPQDPDQRHQDKYVKDMLTKFDMESVRTATTPYEAAKTKLKDETDPPVNVHLYRSMIGSLMYLTASRPDIMFAVSACSRHQVTPLTSHLNAVKKIFKYLKGQPKLGLWYPKDSPFQLEAYSDSDYAGSHGDRKSTTGGCQFLGRRLISWQCKKQTIVATSSTEAEYVAAASCCAQVLWIQNQLLDYGFNFMNTKIFIDNQSTICIVKNPVFHQRTKHIEIRHHFIRDANEKNLIQVLKIHTDDNVADLLTKAFDGPRFAYLVVHIGMVDMVLVSAGCTMVLLVVIFPAGRLVSAGCTMVLLVVIFPAGRLVSAGCTMVLLVVIVPAGFFVPAGSYGLCCWFRVHAGAHTSAGRFISADRVFVPAVYMVSAVG